jgi:capsular polysaccharide transport system permease protein
VWGTLHAFGIVSAIARFDLLILGWLMMLWAGLAAGLIIAAVTELFEPAERFVQPMQYLNIPLSGAFYMVDWLPPWAQKLVLWHPHVHAYEVFRAGFFGDSFTAHYDLSYFFACVFVMSFCGLLGVKYVRAHVRFS